MPTSNGVITAPPKGIVGGNRKKQKRRAKQAAKVAASAAATSVPPPPPSGHPTDIDYDEDPLGYGEEDDYEYSESESYHDQYVSRANGTENNSMPAPAATTGKKKNKKKSSNEAHHVAAYDPEMSRSEMWSRRGAPSHPPNGPRHTEKNGHSTIWNTTSQQEQQNIKEYWLSLGEEERKSLLKIEKEAVIRKMKQQQKHSCSCTVCGRKRTAIEEELEMLYEGYYEELEK
jgi:hypothetical protein